MATAFYAMSGIALALMIILVDQHERHQVELVAVRIEVARKVLSERPAPLPATKPRRCLSPADWMGIP